MGIRYKFLEWLTTQTVFAFHGILLSFTGYHLQETLVNVRGSIRSTNGRHWARTVGPLWTFTCGCPVRQITTDRILRTVDKTATATWQTEPNVNNVKAMTMSKLMHLQTKSEIPIRVPAVAPSWNPWPLLKDQKSTQPRLVESQTLVFQQLRLPIMFMLVDFKCFFRYTMTVNCLSANSYRKCSMSIVYIMIVQKPWSVTSSHNWENSSNDRGNENTLNLHI